MTSSTSGFTETWGYAMRRIMYMNAQLVGERIRALGLSQQQWFALARLMISENATAAELARRLVVDAATMMRVLKSLESRGLITRTRSSVDRRVLHISLSEAGRAMARAIEREAVVVHEQMLEGFSATERAQWTQLLDRVQANGAVLMAAAGAPLER